MDGQHSLKGDSTVFTIMLLLFSKVYAAFVVKMIILKSLSAPNLPDFSRLVPSLWHLASQVPLTKLKTEVEAPVSWKAMKVLHRRTDAVIVHDAA